MTKKINGPPVDAAKRDAGDSLDLPPPAPVNTDTGSPLSIKAFIKEFGIGRTKLYRELAEGRLNAKKAGRRTLIARAEAVRWFQSLPDAKVRRR